MILFVRREKIIAAVPRNIAQDHFGDVADRRRPPLDKKIRGVEQIGVDVLRRSFFLALNEHLRLVIGRGTEAHNHTMNRRHVLRLRAPLESPVSKIDVNLLEELAPQQADNLALSDRIGSNKSRADVGVGRRHIIRRLLEPAADKIQIARALPTVKDSNQIVFVVGSHKTRAAEGRIADNVIDRADIGAPIERKRIALDDVSGTCQRQKIYVAMNNHLGLLHHLIFGNPHGSARDGDGKIVDLDAVKIFDGDEDMTVGAERMKFPNDVVLEATDRQISFGEEIAAAAGGIKKFERRQFGLKIFECGALMFSTALDGFKFVVERLEKQRVDDFMNVFDGSIMHAAAPTGDRIEGRLEERAEDGRADALPIELRVVAGVEEQVVRDDVVELRDVGVVVFKEVAVDVGKIFELRAERGIAPVN